jgi:hypothetical protein
VTTWNSELSKLVRGLDPLYNDIRNQPYNKMETLQERLDGSFEYSGRLNRKWLRKKIGDKLKAYRYEIMELIQNGSDCPRWLDGDIWDRMVKFEQSDKFKEKSQQMRMAVTKRKSLGRTGPKGEAGVKAMLRKRFGRSLDPEDIQQEMDRDKDYRGRQRKKTKSIVVNVSETSNSEDTLYRTENVVPPPPDAGTGNLQENQSISPIHDLREQVPQEWNSRRVSKPMQN